MAQSNSAFVFVCKISNNSHGRPNLKIDMKQVTNLKSLGFTWKKTDPSTLTVSLCVTQFHCLSHGLTVASVLTVLQSLSGFFPKLTVLRKQTQAVHSNAAEEHISFMVNKKTSSRSSLSSSWALLFIVLTKTHIIKGLSTNNFWHPKQIMYIKQKKPYPLFLTDNIKMDRIPTKIKWKIHALLFQVLKVFLIKLCKIQLPDLLFLAVFISFYTSRYHFSQIFRISFNNIWKKDFCHEFYFLTDSLKLPPPLDLLKKVKKSAAE